MAITKEKKATKTCNCVKKVADKILNHIKEKRSEEQKNFKVVGSRWEHQSIYPVDRLYTNYIIESTFEKKDGSTSKPKNESIVMFFSFCPFCGKEIPGSK